VTITVVAVGVSITPQRADAWMSTSKSSTTKFDLKAEVVRKKPGQPDEIVATTTLLNTTLGYDCCGYGFSKAVYKQITGFPAVPIVFAASDILSLRVSIKLSNVTGAPASAGVKLFYNILTPPGNDGHLHAKRGTVDVKYYQIKTAAGTLALQLGGAVPGPTRTIDFTVTSKTTYTALGTWSITGP
jgi:hypothetical protein